MGGQEKVNILLVDDLPAKLLSYELILADLGEHLIKANSAREALEQLLKNDIAVVLVDVCMPDLDGFQLATMIREHPRFQKTAIIFISAVQVTDLDTLRGYEMGGVDYVPVPVVPEVLRAKVRVFVDLYRKTRELEHLNRDLERRVAERTAELQAYATRLQQSEQRRTLALAAGHMGSWDWDLVSNRCAWDEGQYRIYGVTPERFIPTPTTIGSQVHPEDRDGWQRTLEEVIRTGQSCPAEFRIVLPDGSLRWCIGAVAVTVAPDGRPVHVSGVTVDITDRKEAEERQMLLAREVDHRARNALGVVQSIIHLSRADNTADYVDAVSGRVQALARAHTLLSESRWMGADLLRLIEDELAPYSDETKRVDASGPVVFLRPPTAQALALVIHELLTNAAKYGALSRAQGRLTLRWSLDARNLLLEWVEAGGAIASPPSARGFGTRLIPASIERGLGGSVTFDWRPDGLRCLIAVPIAQLASAEEVSAATLSAPSAAELDGALLGPRRRILVVEDESLIALMMQETLTASGYAVVGPFADATAALAAARAERLDAAVLDLNLDGAPAYPVADALAARGVPYILLTGYDAESLDARYATVTVMQKPIEPAALTQCIATLVEPPITALDARLSA